MWYFHLYFIGYSELMYISNSKQVLHTTFDRVKGLTSPSGLALNPVVSIGQFWYLTYVNTSKTVTSQAFGASWKQPIRVLSWAVRVLPNSALKGHLRAWARAGSNHYF